MDWARSSFRSVKRLSLGDTSSLSPSQEKPGRTPVLPRERANSTPARVVMKTKKGLAREAKGKVATSVKRRHKVKRNKSGRKVNSAPSLEVPVWLSRCSHWLGHRRGSYRFGGVREGQIGKEGQIGFGQRGELGQQIKDLGEGGWSKNHYQYFHMVGQDSVGGPLVASLLYSPPNSSLTVRLENISRLCPLPPSSCYTSLPIVLGLALPGLGAAKLQPILCPEAVKVLEEFDLKYPVVRVVGGRAEKEGEEDKKKADLFKLQETLLMKTEAFLEESGFSVPDPKSPSTPGCLSVLPSPNLMKKLSPFKMKFFSPGSGSGKKREKVTNLDDELEETENTSIESQLLVTNAIFALCDNESPTSAKSCTSGDDMSPTSGESCSSNHQERNSGDFKSPRHFMQEASFLRQEVLQLRLQNTGLESEVCRLRERETELARDLISANSIIQSIKTLDLK